MESSRWRDPASPPTGEMQIRRIVLWIGICSVSAAPSLGLTLQDPGEFPLAALILGILTFASIAGLLTSLPAVRRLTAHQRLRRSVVVAYVIRTIFAALPVAPVFLDMWVGLIALGTGSILTDPLGHGHSEAPSNLMKFINTYLMVLWQGVLLNVLVWLLVPLAWMFQRLFMRAPIDGSSGACPNCGYDLRSTIPGCPCPECGEIRLAVCVDCGEDLSTGTPLTTCPSCGSVRPPVDPRWRSWVDRISRARLALVVVCCMLWGALMAITNTGLLT
ncbi:MAG: hypothetical protein CMJ34_01010 [Phycisphaerae bacterium]|nr:hypothetical protein [Phycisphaerae bacterium]